MEYDFPSRWNPQWIDKRLILEADITRKPHTKLQYSLLGALLRTTGLFNRGYRNYLDLRLQFREQTLQDWPKALDGFTILHLSDLHLDLDPALLPVILKALHKVSCDIAVITGDFLERCLAPNESQTRTLMQILGLLQTKSKLLYCVLGNHDSLHLAKTLEAKGVRFLINEAQNIEIGPHAFTLAGVDDAFVFGIHDVKTAFQRTPATLSRILLSHSPQIFEIAHQQSVSLMLSGHTHGGQICRPGGHPILSMRSIPRFAFKGHWTFENLKAYTSNGAGACHLPIRFNCPPEITLHSIRKA